MWPQRDVGEPARCSVWRAQMERRRSVSGARRTCAVACNFQVIVAVKSTSDYTTEREVAETGNYLIFNGLWCINGGGFAGLRGRCRALTVRPGHGARAAMFAGAWVFWSGALFGCRSEFFGAGFCAGILNSRPRSSLALMVAATSRSASAIF